MNYQQLQYQKEHEYSRVADRADISPNDRPVSTHVKQIYQLETSHVPIMVSGLYLILTRPLGPFLQQISLCHDFASHSLPGGQFCRTPEVNIFV